MYKSIPDKQIILKHEHTKVKLLQALRNSQAPFAHELRGR